MVDSGDSPIYRLYHWLWVGIDLLFPPTCGGCGRSGHRWCPDCDQQVTHDLGTSCLVCGSPGVVGTRCWKCEGEPLALDAVRSWTIYDGPVKNAIQRLKYRRDLGLGEALSRPLASVCAGLGWEIDSVVPIPLGVQRRKQRGYNQVALIAWPLAHLLGRPYQAQAMEKTRHTRSQVGLSLQQRKINIRNAFTADSRRVSGRSILLVDDVLTTGSTLEEGARALRAAGADRVYGLTLARAVSGK